MKCVAEDEYGNQCGMPATHVVYPGQFPCCSAHVFPADNAITMEEYQKRIDGLVKMIDREQLTDWDL